MQLIILEMNTILLGNHVYLCTVNLTLKWPIFWSKSAYCPFSENNFMYEKQFPGDPLNRSFTARGAELIQIVCFAPVVI
jgi:hypothetical protein